MLCFWDHPSHDQSPALLSNQPNANMNPSHEHKKQARPIHPARVIPFEELLNGLEEELKAGNVKRRYCDEKWQQDQEQDQQQQQQEQQIELTLD